MGDISFPNIPSNLRAGLFFADLDPSRANSGASTQRALVIGQITSAGLGVPNVATISQGVADAKIVGGQGSMLAQMIAAYRNADSFGEVWQLPLSDDAAAVAAAGSISFTAQATDTGVLSLYIAGNLVSLAVTSSLTPSQLATNLVAAITAKPDLPVSAAVDGTSAFKVNLTAKNKGAAAGDIDLQLNYRGSLGGESTPTGLGVTITAMSGGATNPTLTTALANLGDREFDFIAFPYTDSASLDAIKSFLSTKTGRWSWQKMIYGHAFTAFRGSLSQATTLGVSRNDEHVSILPFNGSPSPAFIWAADLAATAAVSLRADCARPLQTLAMSTVLAPPLEKRFTISDRNVLLWDGMSTFTVADDGTVQLDSIVTTYQKNAAGVADDSMLYVEAMFNIAYVLRQLRADVTTKFARMKLVSDATRVTYGTNTVNPKTIKAAQIGKYKQLEDNGFAQNSAAFAQNIIVQQNSQNPNRVDVLYPAVLMNQLRIFALLFQFTYQ
ncbi:phage tail sheath subtilisin-like domain-containing protein [Herbaspirillum sp. DW155]|uniref:phage tail sheath subtilisin-like domain-containing protein n=1 Tax=Herbaspirillum sp. DW155 TaxID=3095609 RepID=UPI003091AC04|nr:phage tail sheath subtilisin-like domain-containing protein [Herbaspirillum sp. DW155]